MSGSMMMFLKTKNLQESILQKQLTLTINNNCNFKVFMNYAGIFQDLL